MEFIKMNLDRIAELCKQYHVIKLWVIDSIHRFNDESDVDFVVNFNEETIKAHDLDWADLFFDFIDELSTLMGRKVDLIDYAAVSNPIFRQELDRTKQLIYRGV